MTGRLKLKGIKRGHPREPEPPPGNLHSPGKKVRQGPLAPHPDSKTSIVELSAVIFPKPCENRGGLVGIMVLEPLGKEIQNLQRKPQQNVLRRNGSRLPGPGKNRLKFMTGDGRDDGSNKNPRRNFRLGKPSKRFQSSKRRRGPGFKTAGERLVESRQGNVYMDETARRH